MRAPDIPNVTKQHLAKMFAENKRFDGRGLLDLKDLKIEYEVSNKAEGSARVRLGKTEVVVGVKLGPGTPYPDSPDAGNLMVSGDLLPLASPWFESGPPKFDAIELPRMIDRAIRAADILDMKNFVITAGEKVWTLYIDIFPINDDGALIDAASIGALAALRNSIMPELGSDGNVDYSKKSTKKLPVNEEIEPISFSFYKLGDALILHPTREEEEMSDARITFGISKWKGQYMLNSTQKTQETAFTQAEISQMMKVLPEKFEQMQKVLQPQLKKE